MIPQKNGFYTKDAAISSGMSFLLGELEHLDEFVREPLQSTTYLRDVELVPVTSDWVDYISTTAVNYGIAGGIKSTKRGAVNDIKRIQADLAKSSIKTTKFKTTLSIDIDSLLAQKPTKRDLKSILEKGVKIVYNKFIDNIVYWGSGENNTSGLINNPDVTVSSVANNAGNTSTLWANKTPQEIVNDINTAIEACWAGAEYDNNGLPNQILVSPSAFTKLGETAMVIDNVAINCTILTYLKDNNLSSLNGGKLNIYPCRHCIGAGTDSKDRMVVYKNDSQFVDFQIPMEISPSMTGVNTEDWTYDTLYQALLGAVRVHYPMAMAYKDGI